MTDTKESSFTTGSEAMKNMFSGLDPAKMMPFGMTHWPDPNTARTVQEKALQCAIEANKTMVSGCQEILQRQSELTEKHLRLAAEKAIKVHDEPVADGTEAKFMDDFQETLETAYADGEELSKLMQKVWTDTSAIIASRAGEVASEMTHSSAKYSA